MSPKKQSIPGGDATPIQKAAEKVARDALNDNVLVTSINSVKEYGAMICAAPDGTCTAMKARTSGEPDRVDVGHREFNRSCPPGTRPVAYYHTHPIYSLGKLHAEHDEFSDNDKNVAKECGIDAYVGTVLGEFYRYDVKIDKKIKLTGRLKNSSN